MRCFAGLKAAVRILPALPFNRDPIINNCSNFSFLAKEH